MVRSLVFWLHFIVTCLMIVSILMQPAGEDTGLQGGSNHSFLTAKGGASFLTRATSFLALCFFVMSIALAFMSVAEPSLQV